MQQNRGSTPSEQTHLALLRHCVLVGPRQHKVHAWATIKSVRLNAGNRDGSSERVTEAENQQAYSCGRPRAVHNRCRAPLVPERAANKTESYIGVKQHERQTPLRSEKACKGSQHSRLRPERKFGEHARCAVLKWSRGRQRVAGAGIHGLAVRA